MKTDSNISAKARAGALAVGARGWIGAGTNGAVMSTLLVVVGVGLLATSAWVSVPFYPVPMTMQTLAVLLVGGVLGPRLGTAAVAGYLALGLAGAPVFHSGLGGPAVLIGPTGGYLMGFLPAAFLMGLAAHSAWRPGRIGTVRRVATLTAGAVLAEIVIYAVGVPWLALLGGLGAREAVSVGVTPFLLGDLLKTAVAIGAVRGGRGMLARWESLPF